MAYTTTTKTSYGQRLTGSFKSIGIGLILFLAASILLFKNEGNFVRKKQSLNETEAITTHVNDLSQVEESLNGTVIHATAFAHTADILTDSQFGVSTVALKLTRSVAYYQYTEKVTTIKRDKIGGGQEEVKSYTYEKKWVSAPVASEKFADPAYQASNYVLALLESETQFAANVTFDAYRLPSFMVQSIEGSEDLDFSLSPERLQYWERTLSDHQKALGLTAEEGTFVHQRANTVYLGKSEVSPNIGDLKVTFTHIEPKEVSIIARVHQNTFEPYTAKNGKTFYSVAVGNVSAEAMFAGAHSANNFWTWILRIGGIILIMISLSMIFSILPTLFKVIPFLGKVVGAGVGLVCTVGGLAWSFLIISIAWLFYRPLIGIPLLLVTVAGFWFLRKKAK